MQTVQIRTDGKWSINVITGKWRASSHKVLVNHIRSLLRVSNMSVSFHWVKGHSGIEGNERADKLAEQGKDTQERMGGRILTLSLPVCVSTPTGHTAGTFVETLKQAAAKSFTPMTYAPRTPWIQQETLHLLEKAKQAEASLDPQAKSLRLAAKRQAKKDRVTWVHNQLMRDPIAELPQFGKLQGGKNKVSVPESSIYLCSQNQYPGLKLMRPFETTSRTVILLQRNPAYRS